MPRNFSSYIIILIGIIYGIWPVDAIPDIPLIGLIDDLGVLGTTIIVALLLYFKNKKTEIK